MEKCLKSEFPVRIGLVVASGNPDWCNWCIWFSFSRSLGIQECLPKGSPTPYGSRQTVKSVLRGKFEFGVGNFPARLGAVIPQQERCSSSLNQIEQTYASESWKRETFSNYAQQMTRSERSMCRQLETMKLQMMVVFVPSGGKRQGGWRMSLSKKVHRSALPHIFTYKWC